MKRGFNLKLLKPDKKVFASYLFDMIFYILFVIAFLIFGGIIKIKSSLLKEIDYNSLFINNIDKINQAHALLQSFLAWLIGGLFVLGIFTLIIFTIFKGLIWAKITNKKLSYEFLKKFFLINLIYSIPFTLIFFYIVIDIKNNVWLLPLIIIFLHFHFLSVYFLIKNNKILKSIKSAFKIGIIKPNYFFNPYLITTGLFILLALFFRIFPPSPLKALIDFIILVFYFSISRNYLKNYLDIYLENDKEKK